jgi:hypothetical protein
MKKNLKKLSALLLVGTFVLSTLTVSAAPIEYGSNGQVTFKPNDDITDPLDPLDPTEPVSPIDPTDPNGEPDPGTPGPLSIDFASSLDFGEQTIASTTKTYFAREQMVVDNSGATVARPNYVQVSDNRGAGTTGWKLVVKQNGQFKTSVESTSVELANAQIKFANAALTTTSLNTSLNPTIVAGFTLNPNGAEQVVMEAAEGKGIGTYLTNWGSAANAADSISLEVPSGQIYAQKYTTSLTWTLTTAP